MKLFLILTALGISFIVAESRKHLLSPPESSNVTSSNSSILGTPLSPVENPFDPETIMKRIQSLLGAFSSMLFPSASIQRPGNNANVSGTP